MDGAPQPRMGSSRSFSNTSSHDSAAPAGGCSGTSRPARGASHAFTTLTGERSDAEAPSPASASMAGHAPPSPSGTGVAPPPPPPPGPAAALNSGTKGPAADSDTSTERGARCAVSVATAPASRPWGSRHRGDFTTPSRWMDAAAAAAHSRSSVVHAAAVWAGEAHSGRGGASARCISSERTQRQHVTGGGCEGDGEATQPRATKPGGGVGAHSATPGQDATHTKPTGGHDTESPGSTSTATSRGGDGPAQRASHSGCTPATPGSGRHAVSALAASPSAAPPTGRNSTHVARHSESRGGEAGTPLRSGTDGCLLMPPPPSASSAAPPASNAAAAATSSCEHFGLG